MNSEKVRKYNIKLSEYCVAIKNGQIISVGEFVLKFQEAAKKAYGNK